MGSHAGPWSPICTLTLFPSSCTHDEAHHQARGRRTMTRHTCAGAHVSAWYSCGAFPQRHTARAAGLGSPLRGSLSHRDSGQRPSSLVGVEPSARRGCCCDGRGNS